LRSNSEETPDSDSAGAAEDDESVSDASDPEIRRITP